MDQKFHCITFPPTGLLKLRSFVGSFAMSNDEAAEHQAFTRSARGEMPKRRR
jgi:hypothetical protein